MHRNEIIYALICINNHVLSCLISTLSVDNDFDYRENLLEICGVDQLEKLEEPTNHLLSSDIELKTLPSSLKYAFLGPKETLPVIISSSLTP